MCVVGVIPFGMHQSLPILSSAGEDKVNLETHLIRSTG